MDMAGQERKKNLTDGAHHEIHDGIRESSGRVCLPSYGRRLLMPSPLQAAQMNWGLIK